MAVDCYVAENLGRPPSFVGAQIDAPLPDLTDGYVEWFQSFAKHCLVPLLSQAFGSQAVDPATVQRLDSLLRNHPVPEKIRLPEPVVVFEPQDPTLFVNADPEMIAKAVDALILHAQMFVVYILRHKSTYIPLG